VWEEMSVEKIEYEQVRISITNSLTVAEAWASMCCWSRFWCFELAQSCNAWELVKCVRN
jgi:hypothetical protein